MHGGTAVLSYLYDNLQEASMHQTRTVSGYLTLLQVWVYEHFPTLCANCCRLSQIYDKDYLRGVIWKPKRDKGWIRWGPKMYAHLPYRVLREYGHVQTIPGSPLEIVGQTTTPEEMDIMFTQYVVHVVDAGAVVQRPANCANEYMDWFRWISHPYIIRKESFYVAPSVAEPANDDHASEETTRQAIQIVEELLGRQLVLPDDIAPVNELILILRSQRGGGRDWTHVVPYHRRHRHT
uniref:Uncharacterized protein LOC101489057 n=1 Tax=Cicer arietinum TaxID=3827 RepID=A0A1S2Z3D2_CICAR|nr:uncharacterized protein LOC101489057 [Cicer arietinum]